MMTVRLIAHTPEPEKVVAAAAKLCYSDAHITDLLDGLTEEKTAKFLTMLSDLGHASPIEHASFTFGIEGVSRTLLAQITRHRIASFSVQSQRYVRLDDFRYVVPPEIEAIPEAKAAFLESMNEDAKRYLDLAHKLEEGHTARLMAEYLGLPFLDAATVVAFHHDGTLSMNRTSELVQEYGQQGGFVMPGFYGATREGQIKLLDRGGGDISGSILAKCLGADLYENWTDVSGFYSADPRIVPEAQPIARVTYEELRELSYMGASVLHEEAVFPVREAGIPLVIKNTNAPQDPGTIISETADEGEAEPIITGVTGKRGFVAINVARDRTKPRVGFMRRALSVFERYDVSVEHMPTGVDRFGAVVQEKDVHDSLYSLVGDIQQEVEPLEIEVVEGLALIATVGRNLRGRAGISGHLFGMLGQAGVSVRMISQSCDEINIIIGVEEKDFDLAIQTIYRAFSDENGIVKVSDLEAPAPVDPALAALKK